MKLTPEAVYGELASKIHDTGDCWEWTGGLLKGRKRPTKKFGNSNTAIVIYGMRQIGEDPEGQAVVMACEDDMCVQPEHGCTASSDVGRMLYIKEHTKRVGDCLLWTGSINMGSLRMPMTYTGPNGKMKQKLVSVRSFVWKVENLPPGIEMPPGMQYRQRCGEVLCVAGPHLEMIVEKEDHDG